MKQIILEAAKQWRHDKPYIGREIMTQIIETITFDNMEEENKKLKQMNMVLKK